MLAAVEGEGASGEGFVMTDTPRTDLLKIRVAKQTIGESSWTWPEEYEKIERELAAMTKERDAWKSQCQLI